MKINNINNQPSFKRVIPTTVIENEMLRHHDRYEDLDVFSNVKHLCISTTKTNKTFNELNKVLNSEKTTKYSQPQQKKIKNFFKDILGDYNGKKGAFFVKNQDGDAFLVSGKEAKEINKIQKKANKKSNSTENYFILMPENSPIMAETIDRIKKNAQEEIDKVLNKKQEKGGMTPRGERNPRSEVEINIQSNFIPPEEEVKDISYKTTKDGKGDQTITLKVQKNKFGK